MAMRLRTRSSEPVAWSARPTVRWTALSPMSSSPSSRRPSGSRARSEAELYDMDELGLVHHIADAKAEENQAQAELGVHMLLYKHERRMRRRVALRLPDHLAHHAETVSEWVLER